MEKIGLKPKVSVITPVFNAEKYIEEVINSVCNSDYENLEYIIINDGSSDNSKEIILDFISKSYRDIKFIDSVNQGEASAVNSAYRETTGEYIIIVNADDPISSDLIKAQISAFEDNPSAVAAYPDWKMIDSGGNVIKEFRLPDYSYQNLIGDFVCLPGPGTMFKKGSLHESLPRNKKYKFVSDFDLWLRLAIEGDFVHIREILATWRNHGKNLSFTSSNGQNAKELIELNKIFFKNRELPKNIKKIKSRSRSYAYYHAAAMGITDSGIPTIKYLIKSLLVFYKPNIKSQTIRRKIFITFIALVIKNFKFFITQVRTRILSKT